MKKIFIAIAIIILSSPIFFYKLDSIPSGFYVDEVITGYNAYSILLTGKDQFGKEYPILFKFFGSFSPPIYTYLTIIPIKIWGLTVWSTRFISAFTGVLSVLICYIFINDFKITKNKKLIIAVTFFWSISPWVVFFSRIGYEIYLGYLIYSYGIFLLYKSLNEKKYLILSFFVLSLSTYGAHTERFLVPLVLGVFIVLFRKIYFPIRKELIIALLTFVAVQVPHLLIISTPAFLVKGSLFYGDMISGPISFLREFFSRYFAYFSPKSLFFLGDPMPQRAVPTLAVFYSWMLVPYLVGIYKIFKEWKANLSRFILLLLFISPIPAVLTRDPFTSQRAIVFFLSVFLVISMGIFYIYKLVNKKAFWLTIIFLAFYSTLMLYRGYFVLLPVERAEEWNYGYKELVIKLQEYEDKKVLIDQTRLKPIFVHFLFFNGMNPLDYQNLYSNSKKDYYYESSFNNSPNLNNISFGSVNWETDLAKYEILVGDRYSFSQEQKINHNLDELFTIVSPTGDIIFQAVKTY